MRNILLLFLSALAVIILSGCSALFSQQEYISVDDGLKEERIWSGVLFTIPEKRVINKIVLVGEGHIRNIEIYARIEEHKWKKLKEVKTLVKFPYEVNTYSLEADAIRILQKTMVGKGRIQSIKLYQIVLQQKS